MTEAEYTYLQNEISKKAAKSNNTRKSYDYIQGVLAVKSILSNYHRSSYEKLLENEGKDKNSAYVKTDGDVFTGICTISSVHISEQTAQALNTIEGVTTIPKSLSGISYGNYVYWDECDDLSVLPDDLADCIRFAKEHGCGCLCLDGDGKVMYNDLPVYARTEIEREDE